ncbi:hypothetical protein 65p334 [Aeromonas phage 65]|uniref:Uncharacterized protein n=2 Tax=Ishigurovirus osborne TaxID=260149 RepID=A0A219YDB4_9CAUD|nr:hypothetical protein ST65p334 [Aeromonas phage 65]ADQ53342.1 hypothetical protein 65p334 [Aeromonas phage 65]APU01703.1 hypothetical protein [Aeromonas phage 65.2]
MCSASKLRPKVNINRNIVKFKQTIPKNSVIRMNPIPPKWALENEKSV